MPKESSSPGTTSCSNRKPRPGQPGWNKCIFTSVKIHLFYVGGNLHFRYICLTRKCPPELPTGTPLYADYGYTGQSAHQPHRNIANSHEPVKGCTSMPPHAETGQGGYFRVNNEGSPQPRAIWRTLLRRPFDLLVHRTIARPGLRSGGLLGASLPVCREG